MRALRKGIAIALCAAMVITVAPAGSADAAKKPKLKAKASVAVGSTIKLTVKKAAKNAKVKWKSSNKKVAKVTKNKKAKKPTATVKGVKEGSAKITATYKAGKTKKKLVCKVTVTGATAPNGGGQNAGQTTAPTGNNGGTNPSGAPSAAPSKGPSPTPKPSPTPSNVPKNESLSATKIATNTTVTIDGKESADDAWVDVFAASDLMTDRTKESGVRGGETTVTAANAKMMWDDSAFYVLVNVEKAPKDDDSVTIYLASDNKAAKEDITSVTVKDDSAEDAKLVKAENGYCVEAKLPLTGKEVGDSVVMDIQINEGSTTVNYFDTRSKMEYNEETKQFELKDETVKAGEDASVLGAVDLKPAMEQPTTAYYTDKEEEILAAAAVKKADPVYADSDADKISELYPAAHNMTWVDTKYWTDAYGDNPSIEFTHANVPDWRGNAEKVELQANNRQSAQAYTIWSENYLYVLFDIKDTDISPAAVKRDNGGWTLEHFSTDSVEFFLDEDFDHPGAYSPETDEIQIRVDVNDSAFTCKNNAEEPSEGTTPFDVIAYAVQKNEGTGYMVEMIIKFQKAHAEGDTMGMDLQVNDCYTAEATEGEAQDKDGNDIAAGTPIPARAGTITAYDTTNNAYADPSCFGRIKLVK